MADNYSQGNKKPEGDSWMWLGAKVGGGLLISFLIIYYVIPLFFKDNTVIKKRYMDFRRYEVPIISGMMPMNQGEIAMDTANVDSDDFVQLPSSSNIKGGSQYSYSFWVQKKSLQNVANRVVLLRGLKHKVPYMKVDTSQTPLPSATADGGSVRVSNAYDFNKLSSSRQETIYAVKGKDVEKNILVKSPCIRFGANQDEMVVEFNTLKSPMNTFVIPAAKLLSIFGSIGDSHKWVMYTFTFEDFIDYDGFENGVNVSFYVNNTLIASHVIQNDALRVHNDAPLYVMPVIEGQPSGNLQGNVADITFYNYALKINDLNRLVKAGFNQTSFTTPRMRKAASTQQRYYNLTITNEVDMI